MYSFRSLLALLKGPSIIGNCIMILFIGVGGAYDISKMSSIYSKITPPLPILNRIFVVEPLCYVAHFAVVVVLILLAWNWQIKKQVTDGAMFLIAYSMYFWFLGNQLIVLWGQTLQMLKYRGV